MFRITFVQGVGYSVSTVNGQPISGMTEDTVRAYPAYESLPFTGNADEAQQEAMRLMDCGL